jgi:hypothetical protein
VAQDSGSMLGDLVIFIIISCNYDFVLLNIIMFLFTQFLAYSSSIFDIVLIDNKFRHMFVERLVELRIELGGRGN